MNAIPANTEKWDNSLMKVNVPRDTIIANISRNIQRHIPQVRAHAPQAKHVCIVGGGWSLNETEDELKELYFKGSPIIALNGSAKWLMERNLKPSMHVLMDARPDNAQFVQEPIPGCKYFLASQCDPSLFDVCKDRETYIYHVTTEESDKEREILDKHYMGRWTKVHSASTVGVVSIILLRVLGFQFQHLFGMDSCYPENGGYHHAFPQAINDGEGAGDFWCAGRKFRCAAWQASQATSFLNLVRHMGNTLTLSVHGDGLLKHILKTGAELTERKD